MISFTQINDFRIGNLTDAEMLAAANLVVAAVAATIEESRHLEQTPGFPPTAAIIGTTLRFTFFFDTTPSVDVKYPTLALIQQWMTQAPTGALQARLGLGALLAESIT